MNLNKYISTKLFLFILFYLFGVKVSAQDQTILIFDPNQVSTDFQHSFHQLSSDSIYIANSLDENINNFDALFLFMGDPYELNQEKGNYLIDYLQNQKPIYLYTDLGLAHTDSIDFWNFIGLEFYAAAATMVPVDSIIGIESEFTNGVNIDTSFWSPGIPLVQGNLTTILVGKGDSFDIDVAYISGFESIKIIVDQYHQIYHPEFLKSVIQFFGLNEVIDTLYVTILSPNGGEIWLAGTSHTLTWESNFGGDVSIDLYKGGFFHSIITGTTPNDGSMNWIIPSTVGGYSDYRVKITSLNDPNFFDVSDANFTIIGNQITVISPNGGEVWYAGTTEIIMWASSFALTFEIQLFKGGIFHSVIWDSSTENIDFGWFIPPDMSTGSDYTIKIISPYYINVFDISDSCFSIIGNEITVVSPNGGEYWLPGGSYQIEWTSQNVDFVKMYLTTDNGSSWELFAENVVASIGTYDFEVPLITSMQCKIKIVDESNDLIYDESDDVFRIDIFPSVEDYFGNDIPTEYELIQNFPNPFNPSTTIYYALPKESIVKIVVYNVLGKEVATLVNEEKPAGVYEVEWNAIDLTSGIYFYRLEAGNFSETKKMILLR